MAASDGLITTRQAAGMFSHTWLITANGMKRLRVLMGEH
jgi:hypothetical protein